MRICCTLASEVFTVLVNDETFYGTYKCNGRLDGPALTGMLGGPQPPTRPQVHDLHDLATYHIWKVGCRGPLRSHAMP